VNSDNFAARTLQAFCWAPERRPGAFRLTLTPKHCFATTSAAVRTTNY